MTQVKSRVLHKQMPKNKNKKNKSKVYASFQRLGKALLFPIAVLPFAALLNRFGALLSYTQFGGIFAMHHWMWWIGKIIQLPGAVVFDNIALIFAIGVGFGLSEDFRGECALVAGVAYLGVEALMGNSLPNHDGLASLFYQNVLTFKSAADGNTYSALLWTKGSASTPPTWSFTSGVFGGILTAIIISNLYDRFHSIQLPQALSFFGGRRFIPMVGLASVLPLSLLLAAIWPWVNYGLSSAGGYISQAGGTSGTLTRFFAIFTYGFLNRLAQPFGLHHILNTFLWFQLPITGGTLDDPTKVITVDGDINAFQKQVLTSGIFTTCYFPLFLGGLPGAAVAMTYAADKQKRKEIMLLLFGVGAVAFITGIDEPLAFLFIFVSPLLWIVHCVLTATLCGITTLFGMHIGFGFSAGLIDYLVSMPTSWLISNDLGTMLSNPLWIWPLSVLAFFMYLPVFYFLIKRYNIPTPGREHLSGSNTSKVTPYSFKEQEVATKEPLVSNTVHNVAETSVKKGNKKIDKKAAANQKYDNMAQTLLKAIGKDNIETLENCATRLRLIVKDRKKIDEALVKTVSRIGVIHLGDKAVQIVIGTDVEHVADRMRKLL